MKFQGPKGNRYRDNYFSITMPQVAKTEEQCQLDIKISKAKSLLKHLEAQQRSLRLRNKADRERQRRQENLTKLDQNIDKDYQALLGRDIILIDPQAKDSINAASSSASSSSQPPMAHTVPPNPKSTQMVSSSTTINQAGIYEGESAEAKRRKVE